MSQLKFYFMPDRWRSFAIHLLRELLKRVDESEWTPEVHEVEQYMFRYLRCKDCMDAGECQYSDCKCKMPERAHVRTDFCPTTRWGPFKKTKKDWDAFKATSGLEFVIVEKKLKT